MRQHVCGFLRFVTASVSLLTSVALVAFGAPEWNVPEPGSVVVSGTGSGGPGGVMPLSRPSLWKQRAALPAPQMAFDPDAPVVDVNQEAALTAPLAGDLGPTIDIQITPEITAKANELGTPLGMYEFVRNECAFQPYYGSQKGSVETLRQRAGNDYDLASLLIALLRAKNYPARYASGQVELTVPQAKTWLAVDNPDVASSILYTTGMDGISVTQAGGGSNCCYGHATPGCDDPTIQSCVCNQDPYCCDTQWDSQCANEAVSFGCSACTATTVAVRARRVWVEAFVPRGRGDKVWIPLDPSFKSHTIHAGLDVPEAMGLDAQAFIDDYYAPTEPGVQLPRSETPLDLLKTRMAQWLAANRPGVTLGDAQRTSDVVEEKLGLLPPSLPYLVRTRDGSFSEIAAAQRYQIRFHLYYNATNLIDYTADLPTIAGRRISIDYVGATPADQATIDSRGGIYATPPYLVNLKPVLRLDGTDLATGVAGVGMGRAHNSDVIFLAPLNGSGLPQNVVPAIFNTIVCGASQVIGIAIEGVSERSLDPLPADDTEGMASFRFDTAMDYLSRVNASDRILARYMHDYVTTDVANAIVENVVNVTYDIGGTPQTFVWKGLRVDADRSVLGVWPVNRQDAPNQEPKSFMIIAGAEGSLFESYTYERNYGQDSVSTIKILEFAKKNGITIYKRWSSLPLPANSLSASDRQAIQDAISRGRVVTFPASPQTIGSPATGQWTGAGWIDMDPNDGAAGYIISGRNNGGATYESWPPEFIDLSEDDKTVQRVEIEIKKPRADSPDDEAIFTRDNEETLVFEYIVKVTYTDGSTKVLPSGTDRYRKETTNTTKTFVPGNYTFRVWIARRVWWIFNTTIAEAERKVSIVGVLIRKNDGSVVGLPPPTLIPVKLPAPGAPVTLDLMALVIPANDPDGTALANTYTWSGSAQITYAAPTQRTTSIEAAGPNPSASKDAELVDVTVALVGGKSVHGYRKFDYTKGSQDVQDKMTVISVELDKCLDTFLPQGASHDNDVDMKVRVRPDAVKGQFVFELFDISDENGYCLNGPESTPFWPWSEDGSSFKDFQFIDQTGYDIDGVFWNYRATTDDENLHEATVRIRSYDYGSYGKLKALLKLDPDTYEYDITEYAAHETGGGKGHTNLPLDDDDNHIADNWVGSAGNATDDTDNVPALGMTQGDGLTRYEEYRGFLINTTHQRTDPDDKDVFIWDASGIGVGIFGTSNLTVHSTVTEAEIHGRNNREINFNHDSHHLVMQHGLWLRDTDLGGMGSWAMPRRWALRAIRGAFT